MKKLFVTNLLVAAMAVSSFASGKISKSYDLPSNFNFEVNNAADVSGKENKDFKKTTYFVNNEKIDAFYNLNGELIGTSKNITMETLPVRIKRNVAKRMGGYTVKEVIQFEGNEGVLYYVSAENEKEAIILEAKDFGGVSLFRSTKK